MVWRGGCCCHVHRASATSAGDGAAALRRTARCWQGGRAVGGRRGSGLCSAQAARAAAVLVLLLPDASEWAGSTGPSALHGVRRAAAGHGCCRRADEPAGMPCTAGDAACLPAILRRHGVAAGICAPSREHESHPAEGAAPTFRASRWLPGERWRRASLRTRQICARASALVPTCNQHAPSSVKKRGRRDSDPVRLRMSGASGRQLQQRLARRYKSRADSTDTRTRRTQHCTAPLLLLYCAEATARVCRRLVALAVVARRAVHICVCTKFGPILTPPRALPRALRSAERARKIDGVCCEVFVLPARLAAAVSCVACARATTRAPLPCERRESARSTARSVARSVAPLTS